MCNINLILDVQKMWFYIETHVLTYIEMLLGGTYCTHTGDIILKKNQ